ncbi:hypothetical protein E8E13_001558 [Curvularia kusanoi]|uniref:Uncharacterized protein n=1 Tax=Curvularia kusanoi TaxID=90978 RepID=A0A9P4TFU2_CURKU|nr:hypothetical protein E8E13_001558 [Curvularia kusanoi]
MLPANPGGLLWLLDRFFEAYFPNGGDIDMASSSEHPKSVYRKISELCLLHRYKNHPHIKTLKAFVDDVERGRTERLIASNALTPASSANDHCGQKLTISSSASANTIRPRTEPRLESAVEILSDVVEENSDNEGEGDVGREEDDVEREEGVGEDESSKGEDGSGRDDMSITSAQSYADIELCSSCMERYLWFPAKEMSVFGIMSTTG